MGDGGRRRERGDSYRHAERSGRSVCTARNTGAGQEKWAWAKESERAEGVRTARDTGTWRQIWTRDGVFATMYMDARGGTRARTEERARGTGTGTYGHSKGV